MRASNADRERAVDVLKAGFAEGRLSQGEYEQRLGRAYQAQTHGQLQAIVADLPQGPVPQPVPQAQAVLPVPQTFMPAPLPPPTNGSATGALVCGILSPMTWGLTAVPAVILGHKARAEIRRTGESGEGLALAGLIIGWLSIAFGVAIVLIVTAAAAAGSS
ncbi:MULTISPECIES: DUF1707 and DUF4190 domain-containing protein [Streptomyces]|uniref:DUF1707 and DUF4190 domain-containing protein n=1 Tax=Streptomyces lycii TaxID=2654337 RepID=A0ABQ7FKT5_9ACTN|nr:MULTISPECIES: DUF1707 and DUF4190 domain-containing protein [Streptomyces]KAF4407843.1 DUF1707 and DUF4190 domain-containing protein [Streptomyces lycii]PGH48748.1 hypothetical protein CRI70_21470 [Streptomyces sp. Ru87]